MSTVGWILKDYAYSARCFEVSDLLSFSLPPRAAIVPADPVGLAPEGRGLHPGQSGLDLLHPDSASAGGAHLQHGFHPHQREEGPGPEPWSHTDPRYMIDR